MNRKNKVIKDIGVFMEEKWGREFSEKVLATAWKSYDTLCMENMEDTKAVKKHTFEKIYPCISLYEGLLENGKDREEAVLFLDISFSRRAENDAEAIRKALKIPGMYRLMPKIFKWMTVNNFGENQGFKATFYDTDKREIKFDMTQCLYCDVLRKYGYPELIPCFCHTDDVTNGNMHPKLCWHRTKIMGDGGDVCDFNLFIK